MGIELYLANRVPLIDYIGTLVLGNQITICGGLSKYLGYDAAREYPRFASVSSS